MQGVLWILFFLGLLDGQHNATLLGRTVRSLQKPGLTNSAVLKKRSDSTCMTLHDSCDLWTGQLRKFEKQSKKEQLRPCLGALQWTFAPTRSEGWADSMVRHDNSLDWQATNVDPVLPSQSDHGLVFRQGGDSFLAARYCESAGA